MKYISQLLIISLIATITFPAHANCRRPRCAPTPCMVCQDPYFEVIGGYGLASLGVGDSNIGFGNLGDARLHQNNAAHAGDATIGVSFVVPMQPPCSPCKINWLPSVGLQLNFHHLTKGLNGEVFQRQYPELNNIDYNLSINSNRVMLDAAVTLLQLQKLSLFVIGGAGEAWTKVNYNDNARGVLGRDITLNSRTNSGFASEIGAGLTLDVSCNFGVSLEYLYTNFNNLQTASSGTISGRTISINPAQFSFHTQEVLLLLRFQ